VIAALALTAFSAWIYAFWIEPYWIETTHHKIPAPITSTLKIAHLTDIHTYGLGRREKKMLSLLADERPDIIVITGDTVSTSRSYEPAHEVLAQLKAPLGVWLVRGNHEVWYPIKIEREFYESAGVNILVNESRRVREDVWLVGLDDYFAGAPDLEAALKDVPAESFKIGLFHSPAFFDQAAGRLDIVFSGHTHGGQVRLPLVRPFWLPPKSGDYLEGWFERSGSRMYVSRGIGTSILDMRFLCRPELAIITIGDDGATTGP
jgi:uncharacterized protein